MFATQAKAPGLFIIRWRTIRRLLLILLLTSALAWLLHRSSESVGRNTRPAGFALGVLHGALMPCALPPLLLGRDVTIYAAKNTGRSYNLGYTVGVNGCGLVFFGFLFWRISKWRSQREG